MKHLLGSLYAHFSWGDMRWYEPITFWTYWDNRWTRIWHAMDKMQLFGEDPRTKVWNHKVYQPVYFVFWLSFWDKTHDIPFAEYPGPVNLSREYWIK